MNRLLAACAATVTSSLLLGCATPQPALDLANRGVGATTLAEVELKRYLEHSRDELSVRLLLVRQLSQAQLEEAYGDAFAAFAKHKAGDATGDDVYAQIVALGSERRRLREQMEAAIAKLDDTAQQTLGDVPSSSADAFEAARRAFTTLGQELSPKEWLALTVLYAQTITDGINKIKAAEKANAKKKAAEEGTTDTGSTNTGTPQ
jgi:hypothetical protein